MKKLVVIFASVVCVFSLSIMSFAYTVLSPTKYSFVKQEGDHYKLNFSVQTAGLSEDALSYWNEFKDAYSGKSSKIPLIVVNAKYSFITFFVLDSSQYILKQVNFAPGGASGSTYPTVGIGAISGGSVSFLVFKTDGSFSSFRTVSGSSSYVVSSVYHDAEILWGFEKLQSPPAITRYVDWGDKSLKIADDTKPPEHSLTINYQYEDSSQASSPYAGTFAEGESFNITSPALSGFKPSINIVSGQMGNTDLSYTVTYAPIKHNLTIKYQYEDGSQASPPYTGTFAEGESFNITTPVLSGFKPSINIVSGQMGNTDLSYTVTYAPIKHNLTINYQYENGSQALESYSRTFAEGESFSITVPVIGGYKPSVSVISGKMENKDLTYTVTYTPVTHTVSVKYQFEDGSQAAEPYTGSFAEGQPYSIPTPIIEGFTPSLSIISGEMGTGDLSYTVIFTKDKEPEPPPSSSEDSSSGGESSGGGSSGGESSGGGSSGGSSSGGGSSGGSSSGGGSGESSSGGRGYVVWNPSLVAQGFKNVSNQAGMAFNTGIWVFLGITGIVLMIKLLRDLFK